MALETGLETGKLFSNYILKIMAGWWRAFYYYMQWDYKSPNDEPDPWQKHLKFVCCEQIKHTDVQRMLTIISTLRRLDSPE
jgi:hypothetical protein